MFNTYRYKDDAIRAELIRKWHNKGGVVIIGYALFQTLLSKKDIPKIQRKIFQKGLINPGPDLVVCDEAHLLKNPSTARNGAVNSLKTMRRIALTGTPLQNNLTELYNMVQFVNPTLLGKYDDFRDDYVIPIKNGQYHDSTTRDIQIMQRQSRRLHNLLDDYVQRRDHLVLETYLPKKLEYVLYIRMTKLQVDLCKVKSINLCLIR